MVAKLKIPIVVLILNYSSHSIDVSKEFPL